MILRDISQNSIAQKIHDIAIRFDSKIAFSSYENSITYRELDIHCLKIASLITSLNITRGVVGILGGRTLESHANLIGAVYSGLAFTPLNTKLPIDKIVDIIKTVDLKIILIDSLNDFDFNELKMRTGNFIRWVGKDELKNITPSSQIIPTRDNDLCYIMHTSGSTGKPKGVMVSNVNLQSYIKIRTNLTKLTSESQVAQTYDMSFDPSLGVIFSGLCTGASIYIFRENEILSLDNFVNKNKISHWSSVPLIAKFFSATGRLRPESLPTLKCSIFDGEPLPTSLANKWAEAAPNGNVENWYGPTESTIHVTRHIHKKNSETNTYANDTSPIGWPLPGQAVALIDESLKEVNHGQVGQIAVSGSLVSLGYFKQNSLTKSSFQKLSFDSGSGNRWYLTGDLGFINKNFQIECLGRIDNQIKISGQRMELGEVEFILKKILSLENVFAIPIKKNGVIKNLICLAHQLDANQNEIEAFLIECKKYLSPVFIPKKILPLISIPHNTSGKVDRNLLAKIAEQALLHNTIE